MSHDREYGIWDDTVRAEKVWFRITLNQEDEADLLGKAEDFLGGYWSGARIATGTCKFRDLPRLRQIILDRPAESTLSRRLKDKGLAIELGREAEMLNPTVPIAVRVEGHGFVAVLIDGGADGMPMTPVRVEGRGTGLESYSIELKPGRAGLAEAESEAIVAAVIAAGGSERDGRRLLAGELRMCAVRWRATAFQVERALRRLYPEREESGVVVEENSRW